MGKGKGRRKFGAFRGHQDRRELLFNQVSKDAEYDPEIMTALLAEPEIQDQVKKIKKYKRMDGLRLFKNALVQNGTYENYRLYRWLNSQEEEPESADSEVKNEQRI